MQGRQPKDMIVAMLNVYKLSHKENGTILFAFFSYHNAFVGRWDSVVLMMIISRAE